MKTFYISREWVDSFADNRTWVYSQEKNEWLKPVWCFKTHKKLNEWKKRIINHYGKTVKFETLKPRMVIEVEHTQKIEKLDFLYKKKEFYGN